MDNDRKKQYVDMKYFLEYVLVKNTIVYKLINTERNRELLEDIPYIEFWIYLLYSSVYSRKRNPVWKHC